jgi:hypothetical protein
VLIRLAKVRLNKECIKGSSLMAARRMTDHLSRLWICPWAICGTIRIICCTNPGLEQGGGGGGKEEEEEEEEEEDC